MTADAGTTIDALCGWLNARFGSQLPRLPDLTGWPPLAPLWRASIAGLPPDDTPLPISVSASGSWEILPGFVASGITVSAATRA